MAVRVVSVEQQKKIVIVIVTAIHMVIAVRTYLILNAITVSH